MCSSDVKSLFTNVQLEKTIDICINELYNSNYNSQNISKDVNKSMLYKAVKNDEFRFKNFVYRQTDGVAMWNYVDPV